VRDGEEFFSTYFPQNIDSKVQHTLSPAAANRGDSYASVCGINHTASIGRNFPLASATIPSIAMWLPFRPPE